MKVELVVFDMAGTTVYDGDAVNRCLDAALRASGVKVTRDEINAVMGIAKPTAIRSLLELRGVVKVEEEQVSGIHTDFVARMADHYLNSPEVREIEGAVEVFGALKARGVKVALDTGFDRRTADLISNRLGWRVGDALDAVVTSDEVAKGRPHVDMIFEAMRRTGVETPENVAKVGDTPSDLAEGMAAGCRWVVGVTYGSHTRAELMPCPHTHLIDTLPDLLSLLP